MDNFVFYAVLVVIAALLSILFSCLRRYFRARNLNAYQQHHDLRQQSITQNSQPVFVGIWFPASRNTSGQSESEQYDNAAEQYDNAAATVAPPAYSEIAPQSAAVVNNEGNQGPKEEEPPSYSDVLAEQSVQRHSDS
ncbi:uncharacterized protein LOC129582817 [Paramacrobiotus metropolitanus]|uniref:uncharacterized protein LOC129582817 n=1 Tax=Paramacrobiotus metropolitanus TaxID=2943436 RepID=UPI002445E77A|nr:uncharacterized protein LOC129582817 [Paramacrobiotus metropolitanus]XP_055330416.1 uncharacterized protein LOC129582817 [Paramacrobiotus metropolitanus]XP_055330424.1 uncharacterized protein LOC129582817 [Paramacrobiotus metropolitanus]XP_055330430.1 uncharacterized protein LOC129582817 [Paramacrobiotus metropolitanus]XP_055330437.1 uncharacterized protein LOC129582817 [Paramacrobiotus metropolitanus]XP_055330445.1 uncharacterized protein LOC129582817 [Paramacrobiotus metropolitanus]XP_05